MVITQSKKRFLDEIYLMKDSNLSPFVVKFNKTLKELSFYTKKSVRKLSDLKEYFYDENTVKKILEKGNDPEIYSFCDIERPKVVGELNLGWTQINPGLIGNEFYMTKGHFHGPNEAEIYFCQEGEGILILENQKTRIIHPMYITESSIAYISPGFGHRVVNVGKLPLIFIAIYLANSTHDYEKVKREGFGILVVRNQSSRIPYKIIPNPKRDRENLSQILPLKQ